MRTLALILVAWCALSVVAGFLLGRMLAAVNQRER